MNKSVFFGSVLTAFALGGAGMWLWQQHQSPVAAEVKAAAVAADPTIATAQQAQAQPMGRPTDPFAAMEQMQQQAMEEMHKHMQAFFNHDDFFGQGGIAGNSGFPFSNAPPGIGTELQQGEDDYSVFYKLQVGNLSNLNVKVENGYVSINAEMSNKSANALARSTISESFPLPAGVDPDSAKIDKENDAVVIRFSKVS
jgi:HSP20 family molecular chaperone IbpA